MLDWEERLFLGLKAAYERVISRPRQRRAEAVRVELKPHRQSLLLLAQMLAGRRLAIFETENRQLCGQGRVFLPPSFSVGPTREANAALFELKTVLAALAIRERWRADDGVPLPERVAGVAAELPFLGEKIARLAVELPPENGVDFWSIIGSPGASAGLDDASIHDDSVEPNDARPDAITEIAGKGQAEVTVQLAGEDDGPGYEMPMHTFEKVETLEESPGLSRKADDADELAEHAEALEEVEMRNLLRSPERPQSIYRSDVILDGLALEVGSEAPGEGIPYPEWNHRQHAYREGWCFVREARLHGDDGAWVRETLAAQAGVVRQLKRQFARTAARWLLLRRQNFGADFDLDAIVDAQIERRAGRTPGERLYIDRRREFHDIATLILMDLSYSTDAWIQNRRVLDIIRETILCAGEVLDDFIDRFAIAGFASNTRRACTVSWLKDFAEPWRAARGRLGTLQAGGYTRIGPALRHAQRLLDAQTAERKVVLLITDGRPCDYDQYEGAYGIKDVKKAIEEGDRLGIKTHAFAVDKQAREYFPQMFARRDYDIVSKPAGLTKTMCDLYARLKTG